MGMQFEEDRLVFAPVIPKSYSGTKTLQNFKYRNAILNITVKGFGNEIKSVLVDGIGVDKAEVAASLSGKHTVVITMMNNDFSKDAINLVTNKFSLSNPIASIINNKISWNPVVGAANYNIYKNGKLLEKTTATEYDIKDRSYAEYAISALDGEGVESFLSEPMIHSPAKPVIVEVEDYVSPSDLKYVNFSGNGFVEVSNAKNTKITIPVTVPEGGSYFITVKYANGSGPWNTDNKCAIRSLYLNEDYVGVMVFPQRGTNEWSDWGLSNSYKVNLVKGTNQIQLILEPWNTNMNVAVNKAMLDYIRLYKAD